MDKNILKRAGLSDAEIETYISLLKSGLSVVSDVAKQTGLHRTNIYDTLEKLREKGLVAHVIKENTKYFSATAPEKLLDYLKDREEEIKKLLPELKSYKSLERSTSIVELYQGKEGLKTVLKDILREKKNYCVFEEEGRIQKVLPDFYPHFNMLMNKAGIKVRILTNNISKIDKRSLMRIKCLPHYLSFPTATAIYGDKVAIFVYAEPYHAILIKSRQIAESYKSFFEQLWKHALN